MCAFCFSATLRCCSDRRKSIGPSALIAYATSVSPPAEAVAWPGRRCWVANDAAGCPWQSSCKSPRTLQKCKLLITRQLTLGAVLGEHKLSSPSTRLKVNYLCIRYLCFESVRGDFLEGHSYASHATYPSSRAQKCRFCARGGGFWSSERKFWYAECYVK